jgi:hypothetical protein
MKPHIEYTQVRDPTEHAVPGYPPLIGMRFNSPRGRYRVSWFIISRDPGPFAMCANQRGLRADDSRNGDSISGLAARQPRTAMARGARDVRFAIATEHLAHGNYLALISNM